MTPRRSTGSRRRSQTPGLGHLPTGPVETSFARAELVRHDTGVLLMLDGTESSFVDLVDPAHLDFEYHQHMDAVLGALIGHHSPVRALHLGGAGCSLARAWDATRSGSTQVAVEIDEALASLVRQWFDLPRSPRLRIRVGDARQVVTGMREDQWDVVVRDVFAQGRVPESCRSQGFLADCMRVLAPGGLMLANSSSAPRARAGAELRALASLAGGLVVVADPAVARGARPGNLVLVARAEPFSAAELEEMERAVRRLPLPVRLWDPQDPALPRP
ncbi:spermidine synthase [Actinomyces slackii]|uniref:Spermidine synthase n=1 Tax=Actinomyces slackii TaxID=52774 RepID=A0A448KF57_9ACTO|nr:fused MFS/spermidine synthase [Actinomyces slackii]VEG75545.1 spermidine synthase [Actinomyces slackii]